MTDPTDGDILRTWLHAAAEEVTHKAVDATVEALIGAGLDEYGAGRADAFNAFAALNAEVRCLIARRLRELTCDVPLVPEPPEAA